MVFWLQKAVFMKRHWGRINPVGYQASHAKGWHLELRHDAPRYSYRCERIISPWRSVKTDTELDLPNPWLPPKAPFNRPKMHS